MQIRNVETQGAERMLLNPWLRRLHISPEARFRLLCIHHAGGSSVAFHSWAKLPGHPFELVAAELPGRTSRSAEPLMHEFRQVFESLFSSLANTDAELPLVIFGHSMGAILGFELARALERSKHGPKPFLFVPSACRAPSLMLSDPRPSRSSLSDAQMISLVKGYGG